MTRPARGQSEEQPLHPGLLTLFLGNHSVLIEDEHL